LVEAASDLWWNALLSIAYGSGLRRNEILHLTWADVDFEHQRMNVTAKRQTSEIIEWEPKNRKNRIVPMSEEAAKLLVDMQAEAPEAHPYVFVSPQRLERIKWRRRIGKWNDRSDPVNNVAR
jgi:integrase